jgi:hypothetical protein
MLLSHKILIKNALCFSLINLFFVLEVLDVPFMMNGEMYLTLSLLTKMKKAKKIVVEK